PVQTRTRAGKSCRARGRGGRPRAGGGERAQGGRSRDMDKATGTRQLTIREARPEDARLLWEWANDPSVRSNSFNQEPIPWESHLRWYEKRLASPGTRFWLLEVNSVPAGQIRYDRDDEGHSAEI